VLNPNYTFSYTPNNLYTGPDQFTYRICNNSNPALCAQATVVVTTIWPGPPTIVCPPNVVTYADQGVCYASNVNIGQAVATSDCPGVIVYNNGLIHYPVGVTTVTWTAVDGAGQTVSCTHTVTVLDIQPPTIICPPNVTSTGNPFVIIPIPVTGDNCGVQSVINNHNGLTNASGNYPVGQTTVTYTVTDIYGNTATCNFIVVVNCPPLAINDTTVTPINTPIPVLILVNDTACNQNLVPSTVTILIPPVNGTGSVHPVTGTITYTPNPGFTGIDSLYYQVCDNSIPQQCTEAWVFITITHAPTAHLSGSAVICQGGQATLLVSLTGLAPWEIKVSNGTSTTTYSGIMSNSWSLPVFPNVTTTYTLVSVKDASNLYGAVSGTAVVTVNGINNFVLTGGGSYCPGSQGVVIGLSGSDPGVIYTLLYNSNPVSGPVIGTGFPLNFGYQTAVGIYGVLATHPFNNCTRYMAGVTTINIFPGLDTFDVTGGGECCFGCTDVHVYLSGSVQGVTYKLWKNGTELISTVIGNGLPIDFGYMVSSGYYTVTATNSYGCTAYMDGGATVVLYPRAEGELVTNDTTICQGQSITLGIDLTSGSPPWVVTMTDGTNQFTYDDIWCSPFFVTYTPTSTTTYGLVSVSDTNGCITFGSGFTVVTVLPIPQVSHAPVAPLCANSLPVTLTGGAPSGGFYMGPGVIGNVFNPAFTGPGTFTIAYTVSNGYGCQGTTLFTITVNPVPFTTFTQLSPVYCLNANPVNLNGNHAPTGVFSGPGVLNNANGTAVFTPAAAGEGGPYAISYTYTNSNGCSSSFTQIVNVLGSGTVCSIGAQPDYCNENINQPITGFPEGGVFTGPGMVGSAYFNPSLAGVGTHQLTYTVNIGGCVSVAQKFITVYAKPQVYAVDGGGNVCQNSQGTEIMLNGSQTGVTYQLKRDGTDVGSVVSGTGYSISFGFFNEAGNYTAIAGNSYCESEMAGMATINVLPAPVVTMDSLPTLCLLSDDAYILQEGSPAGGVYLGFGVVDNIFYPPITGTGEFTVYYYYNDANHCYGTDSMVMRVDSCSNLRISGTVSYDNSISTPMNNTQIKLKQNNVVVKTTTADANGYYEFNNLIAGTYTIESSSTKPWGGVNASDALLIMKHFAHMQYMTGLAIKAGDVDGSGIINAIDALMVSKKFTFLLASFPIGDWVFEKPNVTLEATDLVVNVKALCAGDVNRSYLPPNVILAPSVELETSGIMNIEPGELFELPITTRKSLSTGAVSLIMSYSSDIFEIESVRVAGLNQKPAVFNTFENELRIAWFDNNFIDVNAGEPLMFVLLRLKTFPSDGEIQFSIIAESEIADPDAVKLNEISLTMPKIRVNKLNFHSTVVPNPVTDLANINFVLPSEGMVNIEIYNTEGSRIQTVTENQFYAPGVHTAELPVVQLPSGLYFIRLTFNNEQYSRVLHTKFVITR